jgi:porin
MIKIFNTFLCRRMGLAALALAPAVTFAGNLGESAEFVAVYTGDMWRNQHGGLKTGSAYLDNLDLALDVDTEKLLSWRGGRFFAYVLYNNGARFSSTHVGDAQVITNIETVRALRLEEFWYEQQFSEGAGSARAGLYDLNSEFYATDSAALFIHAGHGIGTDFSQTGVTGPSIFSITGLALRIQYELRGDLNWRAAVLDAVPGDPDHPDRTVVELRGDEGLLAVGELDFHPGAYRFGWGSWRYSKRQPRLDGDASAISWGSYAFAEFALSGDRLDRARVRGFLRGGVAEQHVNRFSNFVGGGVVFDGVLGGRPDDNVGVAFARARNGSPYRAALTAEAVPSEASETDIEITYRWQLNDRFALQPDIQYVINPDTKPALDNALLVGLRVELTLY